MKPYFYFLFIGLLLSSCDDDDAVPVPETPLEELNRRAPATQTGAGNFGCLINGEVWLPSSGGPFSPAVKADHNTNGDLGRVIATDYNPLGGGIHKITLYFIKMMELGEGSYSPYYGDVFYGRFADYRNGEWFVDTTKSFSLEITTLYDGPDYVMAGNFAFTAYKPGSTDTLEITEGRFDSYWTKY